MAETTYTPGPWRLDDASEHDAWLFSDTYHFIDAGSGCVGAGGFAIQGCVGVADAHLIAAAPDLLEALKAVLDFWDGKLMCAPAETDRECLTRTQDEARGAARAAIAKAEGQK